MIDAYPLSWPAGYERTPHHGRKPAKFSKSVCHQGSHRAYASQERITIADGVKRVQSVIDKFTKPGRTYRTRDLIISTNVPTRKDGTPYSSAREPEDSGVAVCVELDGSPRVFACDKWNRVADNLAAIAASLEALRGLERWGMTEAERAFTGFAALPAPGEARARTCWTVLEIAPTTDPKEINAAWRSRAEVCHPDKPGGSHDAMAELNTARDQAIQQAQQ